MIGLSVSTPPRSKTTAAHARSRGHRRGQLVGEAQPLGDPLDHLVGPEVVGGDDRPQLVGGQPVVGEDVEVTAGPARLVVVEAPSVSTPMP